LNNKICPHCGGRLTDDQIIEMAIEVLTGIKQYLDSASAEERAKFFNRKA
jgi:hypothetical protein